MQSRSKRLRKLQPGTNSLQKLVNMLRLRVREIFHSLQGEGGRAGEASIFIRLSQCNLNCWFCDTDWSTGDMLSIEEIASSILKYNCKWIVWTGGEPTIQLTEEIVALFKSMGYKQAIETNGTKTPPIGLDYITCSPKGGVEEIQKVFANTHVHEFRYPCGVGTQNPPDILDLPKADNYYISPLFLGKLKERFSLDPGNLHYCIEYVKAHPEWKLSMQQHKIWNIR